MQTITSPEQAHRWLQQSFLYVRVLRNPALYTQALGSSAAGKTPQETLDEFVARAVVDLGKNGLVEIEGSIESGDEALSPSDLGTAMAKTGIRYATMLRLMKLPDKSSLKELLEALCDGEE